jgi:hypothetical protein
MTQMTWIDVMGLPETVIDVTVWSDLSLEPKVLVDEDTLGVMESSILDAELFDDATTREFAKAISEAPRHEATGLFDVTELGGGWDNWTEREIA